MAILERKTKYTVGLGIGFILAVTVIFLLNNFISQDFIETKAPSAALDKPPVPGTKTSPQLHLKAISPDKVSAPKERIVPDTQATHLNKAPAEITYEAPLKSVILVQ